jgi:hypothetical protein
MRWLLVVVMILAFAAADAQAKKRRGVARGGTGQRKAPASTKRLKGTRAPERATRLAAVTGTPARGSRELSSASASVASPSPSPRFEAASSSPPLAPARSIEHGPAVQQAEDSEVPGARLRR